MKADGKILKMRAGDAERVSDLIAAAIRAHFKGHYPDKVAEALVAANEPKSLRKHAPKQADFVYKHEGRIVAMVGIKKNEIGHLFVDPSAEGRGIGRRLVEFFEARARAAGYEYVFVLSSLNAVGFYERNGYVREKEGSFEVAPGLPLRYVRLGKRLVGEGV